MPARGSRTRRLAFIGRVAYRRLRARLRQVRDSVFTAARGRQRWSMPVARWLIRHGRVPRALQRLTFRITRGRRFRRLRVGRWHRGFSWVSLARTRVIAVFKRRVSAKKRRKTSTKSNPFEEARIQRIRDVKTGVRRRSAVRFDAAVEAQLRASA